MNIDNLIKLFQNTFSTKNTPNIYFAPGRINIIGEHIDYNGGFVLPTTIQLGTYAAVSLRNDKKINIKSENFNSLISLETSNLEYKNEHIWANYPKSVMYVLEQKGYKITSGLDILIYGNLPNSSGLSSSASLELVIAVMLNDLFDFKIQQIDLVKYCQTAENEYIKVNCGIMDQFAIGMGKINQAILLNSQTLDYEYIPLDLEKYCFVITDSKKKRQLVDSEFNMRQHECTEVFNILSENISINNLCDLNLDIFNTNKHLLKNNVLINRVEHIVSENFRTLELVNNLRKKEFEKVGKLLNESHYSLKNKFEVSCYELDTLQNLAINQSYVLGSRMTGAGFGGCTITLLEKEFVDDFIFFQTNNYLKLTNLNAEFIIVSSSNGAHKII